MNVTKCPCCQRQLRARQEMARQRVKCRYCGAIFVATTCHHDQLPCLEEPTFVPRKTIVNVSAPALSGLAEDEPVIERVPENFDAEPDKNKQPKKDPLLIEETELLPDKETQQNSTPARPKIAAISAPPEQLPLTQNPAIGRREELELDELIPQAESPETPAETSVPEETRGLAAPEENIKTEIPQAQPSETQAEEPVSEDKPEIETPAENAKPEITQAQRQDTIEALAQPEPVEQAVAVEEEKNDISVGEYISETIDLLTTVKQPMSVGQTQTVEEIQEADIAENLIEDLSPAVQSEPLPKTTPAAETLTEELPQAEETFSTFEAAGDFGEEEIEEDELAAELEPVQFEARQRHNVFWVTFITFAAITAITAAGLALWISRNMETESQPVSSHVINQTEPALLTAPEEVPLDVESPINVIAKSSPENISRNTAPQAEQISVTEPAGESISQNLPTLKNASQALRRMLVGSALAVQTLQAELAKSDNQLKPVASSTVAAPQLPVQAIDTDNKIVIGQDLDSCTRLPDDEGAVILIGLAENNTNETLHDILVACDFYTVNGVYAGTARGKFKGDITTLAAGEKVKYAIVFPAGDAGFDPSRIKFAAPRLLAEKRNSKP